MISTNFAEIKKQPMDQIAHRKIATRIDETSSITFYFSEGYQPGWGECELIFDVKGQATVVLKSTFSDRELTYGQLSILARELRIDINALTAQIAIAGKQRSWHQLIALPSMLEDLRDLCDYVATYFIRLAAFHLGVDKTGCTVKDLHVVTRASLLPKGIPYKLLIELELNNHRHKRDQPQLL